MLMAHLLDENQAMSLKWLAGHYLHEPDWSLNIQDRLKSEKKRDTIPDGELYAYCAKDVEVTVRLYSLFATALHANPRLRSIYHHVSRPLQDALFRTAEATGWPLDVARARGLYERYEEIEVDYSKSKRGRKIKHMRGRGKWAEQIDDLELQLDHWAGRHVNWRSPEQVRDVLYRQFEVRVEKQTEEGEDSTDVEALMAVRDQHPIVRVILSHRRVMQKAKMLNGWLRRARDGRVYSEYNVAGPVTGRLSGRNPNPQNIPRDKEVRRLVVASPGHSILAADYKTIELGFAAWQYDEPTMLAAYRRGDDLHTLTATHILDRPPSTSEERTRFGKTPNFGLLYGQGVGGFRDYALKGSAHAEVVVDLSEREAREIRTGWHELYPGVREGWHRIVADLRKHGYVETLSGRRRRFPDYHRLDEYMQSACNRMAVNAVVQTPAGELTHIAAILAHTAVPGLILDVHDSLVFEVPVGTVKTAAKVLREIMEHEVPKYYARHLGATIDIPVRVDIGVGPSWGELSQVVDS